MNQKNSNSAGHIAVVGAGSWGTALARLLGRKGVPVRLWAHEPEVVDQINQTQTNQFFLPDYALPPTLTASNDLADVVTGAEFLFMVTPSHVLRTVAKRVRPHLSAEAIMTCCTKGIEVATGRLMSDVLRESLGDHPAERQLFLSGPSFAKEVAAEHPTAVVIAGTDATIAGKVQDLLRTPFFLTFIHHDIVGVELGGAVKNVMALATGMVEGYGLGHNTRAALITRGLYEMIKLGKVFGADPLTFAGLAGMGDLILTCTGGLSRNRSVGMELGKGRALDEILQNMRMVAEGIPTAKAVHQLAQQNRVNAPICAAVYKILYEGNAIAEAIRDLTALELGAEFQALVAPSID
jgi:glycerol-3-phosphate dehydrogenase (NAD(P)+)